MWMPKQKRARGRPKKNWMEGIRKAMNERNLNEGHWEDRKQWSLGVRQGRRSFETDIYIYIYMCVCVCVCVCVFCELGSLAVIIVKIWICDRSTPFSKVYCCWKWILRRIYFLLLCHLSLCFPLSTIGSSRGERVTFRETLAELRETSYFPIFLLLLQIKKWIKETSLDTILLDDPKIGKPTSPAFILLYICFLIYL